MRVRFELRVKVRTPIGEKAELLAELTHPRCVDLTHDHTGNLCKRADHLTHRVDQCAVTPKVKPLPVIATGKLTPRLLEAIPSYAKTLGLAFGLVDPSGRIVLSLGGDSIDSADVGGIQETSAAWRRLQHRAMLPADTVAEQLRSDAPQWMLKCLLAPRIGWPHLSGPTLFVPARAPLNFIRRPVYILRKDGMMRRYALSRKRSAFLVTVPWIRRAPARYCGVTLHTNWAKPISGWK